MNLYQWALAECLKEYSHGDIIVMAESLDEARVKARANAEAYIRERYDWWFMPDGTIDPNYADDDDYAGWIKRLEADLLKEPNLVENGTIFIRGSE